jgi:hypothetical protein
MALSIIGQLPPELHDSSGIHIDPEPCLPTETFDKSQGRLAEGLWSPGLRQAQFERYFKRNQSRSIIHLSHCM